ncbi:hypothetical protein FDP41_012995 [Naegleria fowleri]|uniref:Uncharacterized protein n=1 Tax=Naegleria fowleri TaxID=5763 RepID=A0A6A5BVH0_NAEFO|nr:uncharacterized protein FDP41_012995 [Naegleria fowleri]KAF0981207.1 hypothetical protein FDP41_012995 [Naegleria fowleri]
MCDQASTMNTLTMDHSNNQGDDHSILQLTMNWLLQNIDKLPLETYVNILSKLSFLAKTKTPTTNSSAQSHVGISVSGGSDSGNEQGSHCMDSHTTKTTASVFQTPERTFSNNPPLSIETPYSFLQHVDTIPQHVPNMSTPSMNHLPVIFPTRLTHITEQTPPLQSQPQPPPIDSLSLLNGQQEEELHPVSNDDDNVVHALLNFMESPPICMQTLNDVGVPSFMVVGARNDDDGPSLQQQQQQPSARSSSSSFTSSKVPNDTFAAITPTMTSSSFKSCQSLLSMPSFYSSPPPLQQQSMQPLREEKVDLVSPMRLVISEKVSDERIPLCEPSPSTTTTILVNQQSIMMNEPTSLDHSHVVTKVGSEDNSFSSSCLSSKSSSSKCSSKTNGGKNIISKPHKTKRNNHSSKHTNHLLVNASCSQNKELRLNPFCNYSIESFSNQKQEKKKRGRPKVRRENSENETMTKQQPQSQDTSSSNSHQASSVFYTKSSFRNINF